MRRANVPSALHGRMGVDQVRALTLLRPFACDLFLFGPLRLDEFAVTLAAGAFAFIAPEAPKWVFFVAQKFGEA